VLADKGEKVIKSLKEARAAYGFNRGPDDPTNSIMKVKFNFLLLSIRKDTA